MLQWLQSVFGARTTWASAALSGDWILTTASNVNGSAGMSLQVSIRLRTAV